MVSASGQQQTFRIDQYRAASITPRRNIAPAVIDRDWMDS
jgi:hypothetical protein